MKRVMLFLGMIFILCAGVVFADQATLAAANAQNKTASADQTAISLDYTAEIWPDVPTADVDWFVTSATFEDSTLTLAKTYNVYPRNLTVTVTDPNSDPNYIPDAFTITITGVSQKGVTQTETFEYSDWTQGAAMVGSHAFLYLSSAVIADCNNLSGNETITVGFGTKLGLTKPLKYTSDVLNVSAIDGPTAHITATANASYDTIDLSGTAPNGSHDYLVFYVTRED